MAPPISNTRQQILENKEDLTKPPAPDTNKFHRNTELASAKGEIFHQTMIIDGVQRTYDIYVPKSVAAKISREGLNNVDTMLAFHGTGGNSKNVIDGNLNLAEVANRKGQILIAPQALGQDDPSAPNNPQSNPSHWHVEGKEQKGPPVDDKAFLKAVQADTENQLFAKYGARHTKENFGKLDDTSIIGMSNGSVMALDVASNPKTYLREGTTITGGAFVTASQNIDLHSGNAPNAVKGEQLFVFGGKDPKMLAGVFQQDPNAERLWLDSARLNERQKQQYDQIKNPEKQAAFALEHQGVVDPETGRTVVGQMMYESARERIVSAAASQGVMISDQAFDRALHKTKWGETAHLHFTSDDGKHRFDARMDIVKEMGHEWSASDEEVKRTGYNVNHRIAQSMESDKKANETRLESEASPPEADRQANLRYQPRYAAPGGPS